MARVGFGKTTSARPGSFNASSNDVTAMIRKKAYELYEKRGRKSGHEMADWLEAERIVRAKML